MARNIQSFALAILITLGLILGMYGLIKMDEPELGESSDSILPSFNQAPENDEVRTIAPKPDRPDDIQEAPDVPETEIIPDNLDIDADLSMGAVQIGINRELSGFNSADGEFLPIFRPPPIYPRRAAERGLCGSVDLEFTVTADGGVVDPVVTSSTSSMFESAAKKASLKYKYKPRQVGGKPVDVFNVPIRVVFEMEDGC